jgi:hypothetical protein
MPYMPSVPRILQEEECDFLTNSLLQDQDDLERERERERVRKGRKGRKERKNK